METTLIRLTDYCNSRKVEITFIETLNEYGLLHIIVQQEEKYIEEEQLRDLERFANWYYDLDVNPAGIEVANHLIHKVEHLQDELQRLKNYIKALES
ncbi:chaperone modulator CbpM [Sphingobacterium sp. SRCM116780]|uniref:chaperone modulator CbpM n=1 Tax=Sphingobacterium sp. SRCM116780 TaxID=2907623 RepID=UPI001F2C7CA9|nr:chaperone modulator CbpM [Sphingobacterium sp. SRCM116780]UIR55141.1 chaperone modulator CbpM [Sphingobacterium sp. SRCM116780]